MMKGIPDLPAPRYQPRFILLCFAMESSELPLIYVLLHFILGEKSFFRADFF